MTAGWLRGVAVVLGVAALFAIPRVTGNEYVLALGVSFATFAVLSGGLNLVYGYTGLLSFAQVGFFGIGGYTAALLVTERGWSLWAGAAAGGALAALVGLVVKHGPGGATVYTEAGVHHEPAMFDPPRLIGIVPNSLYFRCAIGYCFPGGLLQLAEELKLSFCIDFSVLRLIDLSQ